MATATSPSPHPVPARTEADDRTATLLQLAQLAQLTPAELCDRDVLSRVVGSAARALPTADWCSLVLGDPRAPREAATDSRTAQLMDGAQCGAGEGPSVDAYAHRVPVLVQDVFRDDRWERLRVSAAPSRVRAVLSVPITTNAVPNGTLNGAVVGALNYYSAQPGAFDAADDLDLGLTVTAAAATVVAAREQVGALQQEVQNLRTAMVSRASIEQAKGLLAGWLSCGPEAAFEVMSRFSQDRNVKLRDLAALLVSDPPSTELRDVLIAHRTAPVRGPVRRA